MPTEEMHTEERLEELEAMNFAMPYDDTVRSLWPHALRFVIEGDLGEAHCQRRACVAAGECRIRAKENVRLNCGGCEVTDEMIVEAANLTLFATMAVESGCFHVAASVAEADAG